MDWFETVINAVLFVTVIGGLILERKWTKRINERLDTHSKSITTALGRSSEAKNAAVSAREVALNARTEVRNLKANEVIINAKLPDTPHNESLLEALRGAAGRNTVRRQERSRAAHPAGRGRVRPGVKVTGTNPVQTTDSGVGYIPVAAAIALTMDTSSSHNDSSSSSSSSSDSSSSSSSYSDSGSFGGGDSGSF